LKKLLAIIASIALILPIVLDQADAQSSKPKITIWLKVTNTKTQTIHVTEWTPGAYQFEENIPIDVPDFRLTKLKRIFGTDSFTFTFQKKASEANWFHFSVELGGTPSIGEVLSIKFV
jgi:hypothetical protein